MKVSNTCPQFNDDTVIILSANSLDLLIVQTCLLTDINLPNDHITKDHANSFPEMRFLLGCNTQIFFCPWKSNLRGWLSSISA